MSHNPSDEDLRAILDYDVRTRELRFEREKWECERANRRDGLWDGAPLNATVLVAVVGALVTVMTAYLQVAANRDLERTKYESQLILRALEPADSVERQSRLSFLVKAKLVEDPGGQITTLLDSARLPQFNASGSELQPTDKLITGVSSARTLSRARSMIGRPIRYGLGTGGMDPSRDSPGSNSDAYGFVAWAIGFSRQFSLFGEGNNSGWFTTDAVVSSHLFSAIGANSAIPGDIYVIPRRESRPGPIGIITEVENGVPTRVIHCSMGNDRDTGSCVQETDVTVFERSGAKVVRVNYGVLQRLPRNDLFDSAQ